MWGLDKFAFVIYTVLDKTLKGEVLNCSFCVFCFCISLFLYWKCSEGDPCQGKQQEGCGFVQSNPVSFRE